MPLHSRRYLACLLLAYFGLFLCIPACTLARFILSHADFPGLQYKLTFIKLFLVENNAAENTGIIHEIVYFLAEQHMMLWSLDIHSVASWPVRTCACCCCPVLQERMTLPVISVGKTKGQWTFSAEYVSLSEFINEEVMRYFRSRLHLPRHCTFLFNLCVLTPFLKILSLPGLRTAGRVYHH